MRMLHLETSKKHVTYVSHLFAAGMWEKGKKKKNILAEVSVA